MKGLVAVPVCGLCRDLTGGGGVRWGGRQGEGVILYTTNGVVYSSEGLYECTKFPRTMCTVCGRNVVYVHNFLKLSATMHIHVNRLGSASFDSLHNTGSCVM